MSTFDQTLKEIYKQRLFILSAENKRLKEELSACQKQDNVDEENQINNNTYDDDSNTDL